MIFIDLFFFLLSYGYFGTSSDLQFTVDMDHGPITILAAQTVVVGERNGKDNATTQGLKMEGMIALS